MSIKVTLQQDLVGLQRSLLQARSSGPAGWWSGFDNMFAKQLGEWFGTQRWLVQSLIWLGLINGLLGFVLFIVPALAGSTGSSPADTQNPMLKGLTLLFSFAVEFGAIGAVILTQDEIIGEKQSGTAAWILSKPVARVAFILSKLVSGTIGVLVFVVGLPAIVAYAEIYLAVGQAPALPAYVAAMGVVALGLIFYLSLTIMLGVLFNSRVAVIGTALAVFFGSAILVEFSPATALILPSGIRDTATALAYGQPLPTDNWLMLGVTALWTIIFSVIAIWRFQQQEL